MKISMFFSSNGSSIDFPLVHFSLQKDVWEQFTHLMTTPEQRIDHAILNQEESRKFTRKAFKELTGPTNASQIPLSVDQSSNQDSCKEVLYKGKNIANLGGDSPGRMTKKIAEALFTPEELAKVILDLKKIPLESERQPTDDERTELYKHAVQIPNCSWSSLKTRAL